MGESSKRGDAREHEVTALRQEVAALRRQLDDARARLEHVERLSGLGSWYPREDSPRASRELYRLLGRDDDARRPGELLRRQVLPADRRALERALDDAPGESPTPLRVEIERPDGARRHIRLCVERLGASRRVLATAQDVTERVQTRTRETNFGSTQRIAKVGSWALDAARERVTWSEEMFHIFDLPPRAQPLTEEEWLSIIRDRVHPDDLPQLVANHHDIIAGGPAPEATELRLVAPDGAIKHIVLHAERGGAGQEHLLRGTLQDISSLKRYERMLDEAQRIALIGSWSIDLVDGVVEWSAQHSALFGLPAAYRAWTVAEVDAFVGPLIHRDDRERFQRAFDEARAGASPVTFTHRVNLPGGACKHLEVRSAIELRDEDGRALRMSGTTQDISERMQYAQALREREHLLRQAQRIAQLGSWTVNLERRCVEWSPEYVEFFGLAPDVNHFSFDEVDRVIERRVHPEDRALVNERFARMLTGESQRFTYRVILPDGTRKYVEVRSAPRRVAADGRVLEISGTTQDVSERVRYERALRVREHMLREAQRIAQLACWTYDTETGEIDWSENMYEVLGFAHPVDPQEGSETFVAERVHPRDRQRVQELYERTLATHTSPAHEFWIHREDGELRRLHAASAIPVTSEGRRKLIGTIQDITERKRRDHALRERDELLAVAQRLASIGSWSIDLVTGAVSWSDEMYRIHDVPTDSRPLDHDELADARALAEDRAALRAAGRALARGQLAPPYEYRVRDRAGALRHLHATHSQVIRDKDGAAVRIVGAVQDISERKRVEHEREQLIAELADKNAELERFTYTVSHDLKSPLLTIQGFVGFLARDLDRGEPARVREDIDRISRAATTMRRLLDELLDLSRVGRVIGAPTDIDLRELALEIIERIAGASDGAVRFVVPDELPAIRGDRARVSEVVQNLLENAIKFMGDQPAPRVEISARAQDDGARVRCSVRDNGVGIEPRFHARVFGLFERLDTDVEGTGVGLALSKRIVEVHGGTMWVESAGSGHGSVFHFTLPAAPASRE